MVDTRVNGRGACPLVPIPWLYRAVSCSRHTPSRFLHFMVCDGCRQELNTGIDQPFQHLAVTYSRQYEEFQSRVSMF